MSNPWVKTGFLCCNFFVMYFLIQKLGWPINEYSAFRIHICCATCKCSVSEYSHLNLSVICMNFSSSQTEKKKWEWGIQWEFTRPITLRPSFCMFSAFSWFSRNACDKSVHLRFIFQLKPWMRIRATPLPSLINNLNCSFRIRNIKQPKWKAFYLRESFHRNDQYSTQLVRRKTRSN